MRVAHSNGEHLVVFSDQEAAQMVEACALLVLASQSQPGAALPAEMAKLLAALFDGLKASPEVACGSDQDS